MVTTAWYASRLPRSPGRRSESWRPPGAAAGFGLFDSAAAAALSVLMMASAPGWPSDARLLAVLVLALHTALPNKPWGALATRGESDPGTRWYLPGAVRSVTWPRSRLPRFTFLPGPPSHCSR